MRTQPARAACYRQHERVGPAARLTDSSLLSLFFSHILPHHLVRHPYNTTDFLGCLVLFSHGLNSLYNTWMLCVDALIFSHHRIPPPLNSTCPAPYAFLYSESIYIKVSLSP